LEIGPSFGFPPVDICRGTSSTRAAKLRPDRKILGFVTVAAMADAPITDPRNGLKPFALFVGTMLHHNALLKRVDHRLQGLKLSRQHDQACPRIVRQTLVVFARDGRQQLFDPFAPCGATMPSSAMWDRMALISCVRCCINRSRARCCIRWACCSADFHLYKTYGRTTMSFSLIGAGGACKSGSRLTFRQLYGVADSALERDDPTLGACRSKVEAIGAATRLHLRASG
jgi:hypothetical protein